MFSKMWSSPGSFRTFPSGGHLFQKQIRVSPHRTQHPTPDACEVGCSRCRRSANTGRSSFLSPISFFALPPAIFVPLSADAHASLLALMSKWKGAHILSVEQFDEPMLLELFGVAARLKRMVAAKTKPLQKQTAALTNSQQVATSDGYFITMNVNLRGAVHNQASVLGQPGPPSLI